MDGVDGIRLKRFRQLREEIRGSQRHLIVPHYVRKLIEGQRMSDHLSPIDKNGVLCQYLE